MPNGKSSEDGSGGELHRVGVRVPPFYPIKPHLWFAQLESQFSLSNITTDETKFHYAFGQLDPIYAAEVEDVITASTFATAKDKYLQLKTHLINRLSESRQKKVNQLLTREELGDRKPSQFLRHLRQLAGPDVPDDFLRSIWSSRLPSGTQTIIASQARLPLEDVAELADQIHDVVSVNPQISTTSAPSSSGSMESQIAELTRQVHALSSKLERVSRSRLRSPSSRGRRGRSSSSRSQSNYRKFPNCWYHSKFGDKANHCIKPCDFKGKAAGSR